jgi:RNA polymerase sigma-70 factor (ECF subfamily)
MDPLAIGSQVGRKVGDAALVERARQGDPAAFEALLSVRLDALFRTAWAILGSEAAARDATQEACLATWRQLPRLRDVERFDAWLSRVLVNVCRMQLRRRARVREIPMTPAHDRVAPAGADPAAFGDADAIARAFDRLNPDARAILVLHHLRQALLSRTLFSGRLDHVEIESGRTHDKEWAINRIGKRRLDRGDGQQGTDGEAHHDDDHDHDGGD